MPYICYHVAVRIKYYITIPQVDEFLCSRHRLLHTAFNIAETILILITVALVIFFNFFPAFGLLLDSLTVQGLE